MPKKMGLNTKAVEARERKAATKKDATDKAQKAAQDAMWADDDDKQLAKKKKLKEEEEKKKAEALRKKAETKALLEAEMDSIKTTSAPKLAPQKITRLQIQQEVDKRNKAVERINNPPKEKTPKVIPLEENLNRLMADTEVAQTVEQAISILSVKDEDDKHPEKRMKAAFKAYESENLPRLKHENPSLKLSQLKQMVFKEWQKSPENPMNQRN